MHLPDIVLHEPADLNEAGALLGRLGPRARVMAGGTDLLPDLKTGRVAADQIVSIARIPGMHGVEREEADHMPPGDGRANGGSLRIGALTTIAELEYHPLFSGPLAVIAEAARHMASPQVRNSATVGGNLAGAVPCADLPPVLAVLDASAVVWSPGGTRTFPLESLYVGARRTCLRPGEILTGVRVPRPPPASGASYSRFALRDGNAIAVASVAASVVLGSTGDVIACRIMLGAVAPTPLRATPAENTLLGRPLDDFIDEAAMMAAAAARPISDLRGSAEFRRHLVRVLAGRALRAAADQAREGPPCR